MKRPLIATAIAVALVVLLAFFDPGLGSAGMWPVLIGLAVGMAAAPTIGRLAAFMIGIGASWLMFALRAGFLPDLPAANAVAIGMAVLIVGAIGIVTSERLPIWAGLAGVAVFGAAYAPTYAADPTLFLTDSVVALGQVGLAVGIGFLAGYVIDWVGGPTVAATEGIGPRRRTIVIPETLTGSETPKEAVR